MKYLKKLPLLVVVTVLAVGFAASTASAGLVENGQPFEDGPNTNGHIHGVQTTGVLTGALGITCDEAEFEGRISDAGWPAQGEIDVVFDECVAQDVGECTVVADDHYDIHLDEETETTADFVIETAVTAEITCLGGAVMCDYTAPAGGIVGTFNEGPGAEVDIVNQPLTSAACGPAVWDAHFEFEEGEGADVEIGEKL